MIWYKYIPTDVRMKGQFKNSNKSWNQWLQNSNMQFVMFLWTCTAQFDPSPVLDCGIRDTEFQLRRYQSTLILSNTNNYYQN